MATFVVAVADLVSLAYNYKLHIKQAYQFLSKCYEIEATWSYYNDAY